MTIPSIRPTRTASKSTQPSISLRWLTPIALATSIVACSEREAVVVENPGVQNPSSPQVTTQRAPDTEPPAVISSTPADNDDMVMTSTGEITATFSKAMDPMTITTANFSLACPAGIQQAGTVTYAARGNIATLTLPDSLPPGSTCVVTIGTGATDMAGIAMTRPHSWTFLTGSDAMAAPLSSNQ
ncbi:MAG: Ig-like domain-containing protein [Gammaproteobacteria bacterium]|nr:Ig-like domain-containing protein [Gammaproteobacteria bacterium]